MTTLKKRINISVSPQVEEAVALLAHRDQVPQATKVSELLSLALEIEEDTYFAFVAKERLSQKTTWVDHNDTWK
jgi:predicted DNA-binding protein